MCKAIYFDMDGTIADLYSVDNWLEKLRNEDVTPYEDAAPMYSVDALANIINKFKEAGIKIGIVSWSAMNGSKEYNKATRKAKLEWCKKFFPFFDEFHVVKYGTNKKSVCNEKNAYLVDDNADVRAKWGDMVIDATRNIVEQLTALFESLFKAVKNVVCGHNCRGTVETSINLDLAQPNTPKCYIMEFYTANNEYLWLKVGTTMRTIVQRAKEHFNTKDYRLKGAVKCVVKAIFTLPNEIAMYRLEALMKAHYSADENAAYIPNDRYANAYYDNWDVKNSKFIGQILDTDYSGFSYALATR